MKKVLTALTAVLMFGAAVTAAPSDAFAQRRGGGVALGILGGLAAGAIVGSAIASSRAYAYQPGYAAYPGYSAPYPVACPGGYWARRPLMNPYGQVVGYSRPRFFCP